MGDVTTLEKPKGLIPAIWNKAVARAEEVTDSDEVVLFVGHSSSLTTTQLAGAMAFGALGALVARMLSGNRKLEGIAGSFPMDKTAMVVLTNRRFGVGPQKATAETMGWVDRTELTALTAKGTKLLVTFSDGSERSLAFQANSGKPLKVAVERFAL